MHFYHILTSKVILTMQFTWEKQENQGFKWNFTDIFLFVLAVKILKCRKILHFQKHSFLCYWFWKRTMFFVFSFLVADTRLYTLRCRSVGPSVGPSVRRSHFWIPSGFRIIAPAQLSATGLPCIRPCFIFYAISEFQQAPCQLPKTKFSEICMIFSLLILALFVFFSYSNVSYAKKYQSW